ncbi:MAG: hypothetical protein AVDCRST_MAG69-598 [uncultured Solirubrobacteraceae bacterium]|uniref:Uncharacterized protein n=1 Tax=uncultured Solirubrobacteraceae bacterium TaxID=1162706 RepID=A0A6J4RVE8_9ACTN|nr:MAG: hypothetical protein AVDCRST_MAG69-598 [uncultured Solirubrobacteraceae bacterium]
MPGPGCSSASELPASSHPPPVSRPMGVGVGRAGTSAAA